MTLELNAPPILVHIVNKMYVDDSSVESGYMWHNLHTFFVEMGNLCPNNTVSYSLCQHSCMTLAIQLLYDP